MRINYDFVDLQAYLAVLETGSFHLAGQRIGLSQSAVTRRVMKLEEMLETQLFERTTRQVRPTLAAKRLKARAEAMVADAEEMSLAMRDESARFDFQRNSIVTVATIPTMISGLLAPALLSMREAGQVMRVRILDLPANGVAEAVASGDADFGICSIPALEPGTDFVPLLDDIMAAVLPRGHRLERCAHVTWSDLRDDPVILPRQGTGNRLLIDEAMAAARIAGRWSFEVGRSTTAVDLVEAGLGVAVLPQSALAGRTQVNAVTLCEPEIRRSIGLMTRHGVRHSALAAQLCDVIFSIAEIGVGSAE